ncbi:odorant receptor 13a-like [Vespula maculifrons]|uniref:Odorant receptor 13a-like n=1 Tax=Vespula maculifrons TaxID=7453 RepID=A0ABD2CD89_VESMC
MDFFDSRPYVINKGMLSLLGQWPYQSIKTKYIGLIILFLLAGTQIIAKICATIASFNEINVVLNDMSPLIADSVATIQLINTAMKTEKMRELLNRVQIDYTLFTTDGEMKIILEYAEDGRKFTIIYIGFFLVSMLIFTIPPLKAIIISSINGTIERPFIHHVEYFVDSRRYYYPIILHSCVTIFICVYIIVTVDTMFVLLVQHACALFKALGYRLSHITENGDDTMMIDLNPSKLNDKSYRNISECVRRHRDAIEFAKLLESYYSTSLFLQAGFNMIELSITVFQATTNVNETKELFQQVSVCYSTLTHILFQCVNGQRVINHSDQMQEHLINMKWYRTSLRTRKVIYLMLIRSRVYCVLTAAKMFNMSMETFSTAYILISNQEKGIFLLVYSRQSMNMMDFFDGRHYTINKGTLSLLGQWPYQSIRKKYIGLVILFLLTGTQIIAKICAIITSFNDINVVLDDMASLIADFTAIIKLINVSVQRKKMKVLLNRMKTDYALFTTDGEMEIMVEYAENGRKFTIVYIGIFFVSMLQFMIPPLKSIILSSMNGTNERPLIHHVEYFVDPQKYYYLIIFQSYAIIFICAFTIATMDTMFVVFVQHACGLFTTLGYQLRRIVDDNVLLINLYPLKSNDKFYKNISECVRRHQEAIQFAILNVNETKQFFQQICVCCTTLFIILFQCVNGQRLIDHSDRMHEHLINTEWYQTSLRARNGIYLMLIRSRKPCMLTAARMFNVSMETFSSIVRTSISYFTVLRSMQ